MQGTAALTPRQFEDLVAACVEKGTPEALCRTQIGYHRGLPPSYLHETLLIAFVTIVLFWVFIGRWCGELGPTEGAH